MTSNTTNKLDFVILKKESDFKHIQLIPGRQLNLFKQKFLLDGLIGQKYGSYFKVTNNQLVKVPHHELPNLETPDVGELEEKDNRELKGSHSNQRLSKEDIQTLRKHGSSGDQIVDQLVENSSTFLAKTEFSQQKYIKRKQKRHVFIVCLLPLTTRNIHEMYFNRGPSKLSYLRADLLSQMLSRANIYAGCKAIVYEACSGIVVRAILERMSGSGRVVHIFSGTAPSRPTMDAGLALLASHEKILYDFPVNRIADLFYETNKNGGNESTDASKCDDDPIFSGDVKSATLDSSPTEIQKSNMASSDNSKDADISVAENKKPSFWKRQNRDVDIELRNLRREERLRRIEQTKALIRLRDTNALIIAGKVHPVSLATNLLEFVAPSCQIVIFCPYHEPLVECYQVLKDKGVLALKITETFYRGYQFLKNRTHPKVLMSGNGGYLLTGIKVI